MLQSLGPYHEWLGHRPPHDDTPAGIVTIACVIEGKGWSKLKSHVAFIAALYMSFKKGEIKSIAVIGAGASGAMALDTLVREQAFDTIKVFERREKAGGVWHVPSSYSRLNDEHVQNQPVPIGIQENDIDPPLPPPDVLPAKTKKSPQERYDATPIYSYLETNIDVHVMEFTEEPISDRATPESIARFGANTPFRHHSVIQHYVEGLFQRHDYEKYIEFRVTVERVAKSGKGWTLTLRRSEKDHDYWWQEYFDAVAICSGHYSVPFVPDIPGLVDMATTYPGSVEHTKGFRSRNDYKDLNVVIVGGNISAMDAAFDIVDHAKHVGVAMRGKPHPYFTDTVFTHPAIHRHTGIRRIDAASRSVYYYDGTVDTNVDKILLGTGYRFSLPFLKQKDVSNNRIHGLYQHVVNIEDPTLAFIGAVNAGLTFKTFEWQAVLVSRLWSGRCTLPSVEEQYQWEMDRIRQRGDNVKFTVQYPDFEEYFNTLRDLAGNDGPGRKLPVFDPSWREGFEACVALRISRWKYDIENATKEAKKGCDKQCHL